MKITYRELLAFGALACAGWLVSKVLDKISAAGETAGNAIGDVLAPLFTGAGVSVNARIALPDGRTIDVDAIIAAGGSIKNDNTFVYLGQRYKLGARRSDGVYTSTRV